MAAAKRGPWRRNGQQLWEKHGRLPRPEPPPADRLPKLPIRRKESGKAAARRDVYSNCSRKILIGVAVVGVLGGGAVTAVHYLGQQQEQEVAVASANMEVLPTGAQETAPTVMPTASADDEIILTPEPEADDEIILTPEPEADDEIILTPEPESDDEIILMPEPGEGDEIVITPGEDESDEIVITPGDDEIVILPGEGEDAVVTPVPEEPGIILEQPVADEDFPSLLAGNLTKEELQLVLTYSLRKFPGGAILIPRA